MAYKIKRGMIVKRYYCSECNFHVQEDEDVCQRCGAEFIEHPTPKMVSNQPKRSPTQIAEQIASQVEEEPIEEEVVVGSEIPEEEFEEDYDDEAIAEQPPPQPRKGIFSLPKFKTVLWVVIAALLLWGMFASDTSFIVAAVLVLVVVELEAIRRKLGMKQ